MRKSLRRGLRGFTLIELLAVMAILGILTAIVVPAVSSTGNTGREASPQESASGAGTAVNDFFNAQAAGETLSTSVATTTTKVNGATVPSTTQVISSVWPEKFIASDSAALYRDEFPVAGNATDGVVVNVVLKNKDGATISGAAFLADYTAIDFDKLVSEGFMTETPDTATSLSNELFQNFLWLLRKYTSASSSSEDDSRKVAVFRLASVTVTGTSPAGSTLPSGIANKTAVLTYEQVF